jgi:cytochrome P450
MFDLNDEAFLKGDRRTIYAKLRAESPVLALPAGGGPPTWIVSRHKDVQALLRMPGGRVHPLGMAAPPWMPEGPARQRLQANLSQTDAPVHARLRSVLGPLFIPRKVEALRAVSADSVARSLNEVADRKDGFDVVQELAVQVPKGLICHVLGVPEEDWARLVEVQHNFLQIFSLSPLAPEQQRLLDEVTAFYFDYFASVLEKGDPAQRPPFVEQLLAAESRGELSRIEVLSLMHTVLDAGYETTRTSISNAVELLATIPGLFDALRDDPSLVPNAVEEILRYESPVHLRFRFLSEPFAASDGTVLPEGALVIALIAAANQDETVFESPLRLDLKRPNAAHHQAFGGGLHHCLGAPIARIQLQETLRGLATTFSRFELPDGPGPRFPLAVFPALASLRVVATR